MAFLPTNKPHKNTEAEKCGSKGKCATNISDFTSVCRLCKALLLCGKTYGGMIKLSVKLFPANIFQFKVKVKQTFQRNNPKSKFFVNELASWISEKTSGDPDEEIQRRTIVIPVVSFEHN